MDTVVRTWQELVQDLGSVARARVAVRDAHYWQIVRGAYAPTWAVDSPALRAEALRRVLPPHAVLSHWSSLWVRGLDVLARDKSGEDLLDLTVPPLHHVAARPGMTWCSGHLVDDDLCEVEGLVVASAARGCVDVARRDGVVEGVACADAALRAGMTTLALLRASVERCVGLPWVTRARTMLKHVEPRSESLMESRLRVGFVLAGGPRMPAQVDVYDEDGSHCGRADLLLDGVVVEYDGREERLQLERFTSDRRRQNSLADLGLEIRRFSASMYYRMSPEQRLAVLTRALEVAAGRSRRVFAGPDTLRRARLSPLPTLADTQSHAQARRTA